MDNILIINGDLEFLCEEIGMPEGFEAPTYRTVFIDPPERDGSLFINELAGKREFSWRGLIKEDVQVNRRLLSRVCQPGGLKTIKFTLCDGVDVQTDAVVQLISPYRKDRCPYLINAKSPYAYFVSQVLHSEMTYVTQGRGGLPIPAAIPAPIGEGGSTPLVINNAGDTFAYPNFTIKGPGNNFLIKNLDTDESIRVDLNFGANEAVTINTTTNEAFKGNQSVFGYIERTPIGKWLTLRPGNNRIVFYPISGSNDSTKLTIEWRDTYSGF